MSNLVLEMSDATNRQRRNMMLSSIALILIFHAGMTFNSELKLFGASVSILKPNTLVTFLIIIHLYFIWRFYQYFHTDKAVSSLLFQYKTNLNAALDMIVKENIFKSLPKGTQSIHGDYTYRDIAKAGKSDGCYTVIVNFPVDGYQSSSQAVDIPTNKFRFKSLPVLAKFAFRGKVVTDYYLPFLLALYGFAVNIL